MSDTDLRLDSPPSSRAVRVTLAPSVGLDLPALVLEPDADGPERLEIGDRDRATLVTATDRRRILFGSTRPTHDGRGAVRREVVVDGWRVEVEVESAARAALRARAQRDRGVGGLSGPTEVRAIIPGRVVSVSIVVGDVVEVGQQLLVVEAMKMQNELRAPRAGTVARIAATPGATIETGDVLLVLE